MCTLLFAFQVDPAHPLVIAANRDEHYARPTQALAPWPDHPSILAGRDLLAGGTWMGLARSGRWAALTNVRERPSPRPEHGPQPRSRGGLVRDFLAGTMTARAYLDEVARDAQAYEGFNLVLGGPEGIYYASNRGGAPPTALQPGIYGLSNAGLDTPWPKVVRGKERLAQLLAAGAPTPDALLDLLRDRRGFADEHLPDTGVGLEVERALAPLFIATPSYGTRSSTAIVIGRDRRAQISEFTVDPVDPGGHGRVDLDLMLASSELRTPRTTGAP